MQFLSVGFTRILLLFNSLDFIWGQYNNTAVCSEADEVVLELQQNLISWWNQAGLRFQFNWTFTKYDCLFSWPFKLSKAALGNYFHPPDLMPNECFRLWGVLTTSWLTDRISSVSCRKTSQVSSMVSKQKSGKHFTCDSWPKHLFLLC